MFATKATIHPREVGSMTLTEVFGIASQIITNHFIESQQNIDIPTMVEKPEKIIDQQQDRIEEQAKVYWDTMFPQVEKEEEEYPDEYPDEFKEKGLDK